MERISSVQFSNSVVSDSLWPYGLQQVGLPCPSRPPRVYSNSCPSSRWCHPAISSSVFPFSSHLQSFPASGSFPMSQFFTSGGQSIEVSVSASERRTVSDKIRGRKEAIVMTLDSDLGVHPLPAAWKDGKHLSHVVSLCPEWFSWVVLSWGFPWGDCQALDGTSSSENSAQTGGLFMGWLFTWLSDYRRKTQFLSGCRHEASLPRRFRHEVAAMTFWHGAEFLQRTEWSHRGWRLWYLSHGLAIISAKSCWLHSSALFIVEGHGGCGVKVILGAGYQGMSPLQNFEPDEDDFTDRYGCACVHMHRHAYLYTDTGMCI